MTSGDSGVALMDGSTPGVQGLSGVAHGRRAVRQRTLQIACSSALRSHTLLARAMAVDPSRVRNEAIRALVILAVGQRVSALIRWGPRQGLPSILNTGVLKDLMEAEGVDPGPLLLDDSPKTPLEKAQGRWRPAMAALTAHNPKEDT